MADGWFQAKMADPAPNAPTILSGLGFCCFPFGVLLGYEFVFAALAFSAAGLVLALRPCWTMSNESRPAPTRPPSSLALVAAIGVAIASVWAGDILDVPHWRGSGDWVACGSFAVVGPRQAVLVAGAHLGIDLMESSAGVAPRFLNESGWEFDVTCSGGLSVITRRAQLPFTPRDGLPHFAWFVSFTHHYELLASLTWINWTTGSCVASCFRR